MVLFVMDLAVNQKTGMLLYRLHDDLWLCGEPQQYADAWQTMEEFAEAFGVTFSETKTGSVYLSLDDQKPRQEQVMRVLPKGDVRVGHLVLDADTAKWKIDLDQVSQHVRQLKKQLTSCRSVLEWIRTWNSCIGRFFNHMFGEPAPCFGVEHVDSMLRAYQSMQESLFGSANIGVVQHIKAMLQERFSFDSDDIPDAFIVLPEELGGLGVRNPFIAALAVRGPVEKYGTAVEIMGNFSEQEKQEYHELRKSFDQLDDAQRIGKYCAVSGCRGRQEYAEGMLGRILSPAELKTFMSLEEFSKWRKVLSGPLAKAYELLMAAPETTPDGISDPALESAIWPALHTIGQRRKDKGASAIETRGNLQLYREELREECGGWSMVEERYLPLGVLAMMRRKAVRWNMVL